MPWSPPRVVRATGAWTLESRNGEAAPADGIHAAHYKIGASALPVEGSFEQFTPAPEAEKRQMTAQQRARSIARLSAPIVRTIAAA
jgi:hypothetical protein